MRDLQSTFVNIISSQVRSGTIIAMMSNEKLMSSLVSYSRMKDEIVFTSLKPCCSTLCDNQLWFSPSICFNLFKQEGAFHFNHNWWDCMESIKSHCCCCFSLCLSSTYTHTPALFRTQCYCIHFYFSLRWVCLVKLWTIRPSNQVSFAQYQTSISC